jgi:hypothetical protein
LLLLLSEDERSWKLRRKGIVGKIIDMLCFDIYNQTSDYEAAELTNGG